MIVIVGQAPSRKGNRRLPFEGRSGDRLANAFGLLDHVELRARFRVVNVLKRWPGAAAKGDLFPIDRAKRAARRLHLPKGAILVLAGLGVARAFGFVDPEFFRWAIARGRRATVIPHPSGVSLWWNERSNRARAARFLRALARQHL